MTTSAAMPTNAKYNVCVRVFHDVAEKSILMTKTQGRVLDLPNMCFVFVFCFGFPHCCAWSKRQNTRCCWVVWPSRHRRIITKIQRNSEKECWFVKLFFPVFVVSPPFFGSANQHQSTVVIHFEGKPQNNMFCFAVWSVSALNTKQIRCLFDIRISINYIPETKNHRVFVCIINTNSAGKPSLKQETQPHLDLYRCVFGFSSC